MSVTLKEANSEWSSRPNDERFWSIEEFAAATTLRRQNSVERLVRVKDCRFVNESNSLNFLVGDDKIDLGNLSFGQLANKLGYPVKALDTELISVDTICQILNERVAAQGNDDKWQILIGTENDKKRLRCLTSEVYARFWDNLMVPMLMRMQSEGWIIPPARPVGLADERVRPATKEDVLWLENAGGGTSVSEGDLVAPAGIYSGDRNSFIFLINQKAAFEDDVGNVIYPGRIFTNSEVGEGSYNEMRFNMQGVCGNHFIWDASDIVSISYRHVGNAPQRILESMSASRQEDYAKIAAQIRNVFAWMRTATLGSSKDEVIENVYAMRLGPQITQSLISDAIVNAQAYREVDGDPYTWLGFMNAVTRNSQNLINADERFAVDKQISKLTIKATKYLIKQS
jgi:hypothetical protein